MTCNAEHVFIYLLVICMSSSCEVSVQVFCPFLNWVVHFITVYCFKSSLYFLNKNPLSHVSLASIFSQSVASNSLNIFFCGAEVFKF